MFRIPLKSAYSDSGYAGYVIDFSGGSSSEDEIMNAMDTVSSDRSLWGSVIQMYYVCGSADECFVEPLMAVVHSGIPLIFSTAYRLSYDRGRVSESSDGETLMTRLFSRDNTSVYSIGKISDGVDAMKYASDYCAENPLVPSSGIDSDTAIDLINRATSDVYAAGNIVRPGKSGYAVYCVGPVSSMAMRNNKDSTDDPVADLGYSGHDREVILVGGNPPVGYIGCVCNMHGFMFDVWTVNSSGCISAALSAFNNMDIAMDDISVDYSDAADILSMHIMSSRDIERQSQEAEDDEDASVVASGEIGEDSDIPDT